MKWKIKNNQIGATSPPDKQTSSNTNEEKQINSIQNNKESIT